MSMNEETTLESIEIETGTPVQKSIILLHGLGADASDFVPIVSELNLPANYHIRFIFPHAPIMPITINSGYKMRAWYDIYGLALHERIDRQGINQSIGFVNTFINKEIARGISASNIILAGFSQGAVIALSTGLTYPKSLGGIVALSGYLPLADEIQQKITPANQQIPIFLAHGTEDHVVPYALGKAAYAALKQASCTVAWHAYPMAHTVCANELHDISHWLQKLTPNK